MWYRSLMQAEVLLRNESSKGEWNSWTVRFGISGAYRCEVKIFDDLWRNTRGSRPVSVIPASRKGYSLALRSQWKANKSHSVFYLSCQSKAANTTFRPVLPALLWSSLTAPKFRGFLNKASYDSFKLSNGHGVLMLLFAVCYIVPWLIQVRIPTVFARLNIWHG